MGSLCGGDMYRLVAAVEESNANFSAFIFPSHILINTKLCGFPVYSSEFVTDCVLGGMWNDIEILLDKKDYVASDVDEYGIENSSKISFGIKINHGAAFCILDGVKNFNLEGLKS